MTRHYLVTHEWRTVLSRPAALLSLVLFLACLTYAAVNGRVHVERRFEAIAQHQAGIAASRERWLSDLRALEEQGQAAKVPAWSGSAMDISFSSHLPVAPLGDFAIGQSDLLPSFGGISLWDSDVQLFSRYQFEDPVSLDMGGLDLSKATILMLPLMLIAFCFNVLSADRDANRLSLLLAQGADLRTMLWQRLAIRASMILIAAFLPSLTAFLWPSQAGSLAQRLPFFASWSAAFFFHAAFWIAIIAAVASGTRTAKAQIVLLLLAWAGFTFILPASVVAISEAVYPTPSRATYLAEARSIEIDTELAEADLTRRAIIDHPEMLGGAADIPDYVRTAYLVTTTVDGATRPILSAFESAADRREVALSWARALSPAMIMQSFCNDLAGVSSARHRSYMEQGRELKADYARRVRSNVLAGRRLSVAEAASLPVFRFEEEQASSGLVRRHAGAGVFLVLATCMLLTLTDRRMRRLS